VHIAMSERRADADRTRDVRVRSEVSIESLVNPMSALQARLPWSTVIRVYCERWLVSLVMPGRRITKAFVFAAREDVKRLSARLVWQEARAHGGPAIRARASFPPP
jgi:hypothetical protein